MKFSDSMGRIAPALVAAQAEIRAIGKDRKNTFFGSKYATLDAMLETVRPILSKHGLSVVQGSREGLTILEGVQIAPSKEDRQSQTVPGQAVSMVIDTMLIHESGEYVSTSVTLPLAKNDPQGAGSAFTYGRRYTLGAILALATEEDDDANAASIGRRAAGAEAQREHREQESRAATAAQPTDAKAPSAPAADDVPPCPKCGGSMWDNRSRKAQGRMSAKAPDFKCKKGDECGGLFWPGQWPPKDEGQTDAFDAPKSEGNGAGATPSVASSPAKSPASAAATTDGTARATGGAGSTAGKGSGPASGKRPADILYGDRRLGDMSTTALTELMERALKQGTTAGQAWADAIGEVLLDRAEVDEERKAAKARMERQVEEEAGALPF